MEIPEEVIDQLAKEIMAELEENAKKTGKALSFDDIEKSMIVHRNKLEKRIMETGLKMHQEMNPKKKLSKMRQ